MTSSPGRRIVRFLGSAALATWLLVFVGVWSIVGSLVPQSVASESAVKTWETAHPFFAPIARFLGLHQAFSAPIFLACVVVLGDSTAICAWQRTKLAFGRARRLAEAARADRLHVVEHHDFEIATDASLGEDEVLSIAEKTLATLNVKTRPRDGVLRAVSSAWSVWGSPIFHWALFGLLVALIVGNLGRSEGLMGVAVGQTKPDAPASYGKITTGPLRGWSSVNRSIRVDRFEPDYMSGGIDRGPTPTVTVLDGSGKVIKSQRVYPNATLKSGTLTIYPSDYGLATDVTLISPSGGKVWQGPLLVDFATETTSGTRPVDYLDNTDASTNQSYRIYVSVPLDRVNGAAVNQLPKNPTAQVDVVGSDGTLAYSKVVSPGETVSLPGGGALQLDNVNYYARLSVVDDWSIPLLLVGLVVAMVGLTIAVVARQQIILLAVVDGPDGTSLAATVRLWRNAASSRGEIESELTRALTGGEKESTG
ncbi:MAG: cytochrome c biogenesis protein ResB [Coriobacteriia bacterium]|nr:cytochrome c biogenesis protein ResB [Coriobacteriia bacterium]